MKGGTYLALTTLNTKTFTLHSGNVVNRIRFSFAAGRHLSGIPQNLDRRPSRFIMAGQNISFDPAASAVLSLNNLAINTERTNLKSDRK